MAAPFTSTDAQQAIPNLLRPACDELNKAFVIQPDLRYRLVQWMIKDDGTISDEFAEWLCTGMADTSCATSLTGTTTSTSTVG